jgi:hypothetical protein
LIHDFKEFLVKLNNACYSSGRSQNEGELKMEEKNQRKQEINRQNVDNFYSSTTGALSLKVDN